MQSLFKLIDAYEELCNDSLLKIAVIKELSNGKYRVESHKGKNLGTYTSKEKAKQRLKQVEFFKHLDKNNADTIDNSIIDLSDLQELSYSALLRSLNKKTSKEICKRFMQLYKKEFDKCLRNGLQKPQSIAMQNALVLFNKEHKIKLNKDLIKNAALTELGDPKLVGKYLSDIVKFTITRIKPENRSKALESLKRKIYALNEAELSNKNLPASSSMGQSITFIKHVLFNHDAKYIREVLNNIVRNL